MAGTGVLNARERELLGLVPTPEYLLMNRSNFPISLNIDFASKCFFVRASAPRMPTVLAICRPIVGVGSVLVVD